MASPSSDRAHDYTEGASAVDIQKALANNVRGRRDSQYGIEGEGAMFDGPGHSVNPSSVSRMSLDHRRRSSEWSRPSRSRRRSEASGSGEQVSPPRRRSRESKVSYGSVDHSAELSPQDGDLSNGEGELHGMSRRPRRTRSPSSSPPPHRHTVFENLAHMFGRGTHLTESPSHSRRPSISSRSSRTRLIRRSSSRRSNASSNYAVESEDEGDERWGYSSGEEDESEASIDGERTDAASIATSGSELDYGSYPPSPSARPSLPFLSDDVVFGGEARIDIGDFDALTPPPAGPPSRQTIYLADEDTKIRLIGYEVLQFRQWLWRLCCVLTCGLLALLGRWFPRAWLRWVAQEKAFKQITNGFIVVEVRFASPLCMVRVVQLSEDRLQRYFAIPTTAYRVPLRTIHCIPIICGCIGTSAIF